MIRTTPTRQAAKKMQNYPCRNAQFLGGRGSGTRKEIHKTGLEHLTVPKRNRSKKNGSNGGVSQEHRNQQIELSIAKMNNLNEIIQILLDSNPKCRISLCPYCYHWLNK